MVSYPTDTPILSAYRKLAGAVTKPRDNFPVNVFTMYPKRQTSLSNGASRGHAFSVNVLLTFTPLCSEKHRVQPLLSYPSSPKAQLDAAQRPIRVPLSRSRTLGFSPPHPPLPAARHRVSDPSPPYSAPRGDRAERPLLPASAVSFVSHFCLRHIFQPLPF